MRQTQLLKLDAPYTVMWDDAEHLAFKHFATLIDVELDDEPESFLGRVVEHPVTETGHVLRATLDDCEPICQEGGRIDLMEFCGLLAHVDKSEWFPHGDFSIYTLSTQLRAHNIDVELPGEAEANGGWWDIDVELSLGDDGGIYWVESGFTNFLFDTRLPSNESNPKGLKFYLRNTRDDYYRAFPGKKFRIVLSSKNGNFADIIEELNKTDERNHLRNGQR